MRLLFFLLIIVTDTSIRTKCILMANAIRPYIRNCLLTLSTVTILIYDRLSCDSLKLHIQKSATPYTRTPAPSHDRQSFMRDSLLFFLLTIRLADYLDRVFAILVPIWEDCSWNYIRKLPNSDLRDRKY